MIGYHYTSYSNWLAIQKEGLQPQFINKPELKQLFPQGVKGVWTWEKRPTGQSELGSIMFQIGTKQETTIVLLEYSYRKMLSWNDQTIRLSHDGVMGSWWYHESEPAVIVTEPVETDQIRLVKTFDMVGAIR